MKSSLGVMTYLTRSPIPLAALLAEVSSPECGGTCAFLGTVRDGPEEHGVTAIEYSAYEEMVDGELGRIVAEVRERWSGARVAACRGSPSPVAAPRRAARRRASRATTHSWSSRGR